MSRGQNHGYVKRLAMPIDRRRDIKCYGESNLYPQIVEQIGLRSVTTVAAIKAARKYISGEGFSKNGEIEINRHEQTIDELLFLLAKDKAQYDGYAIHINVDELLTITELTYVDFKLVRYGLPDENGIHKTVKINDNWEKDPNKNLTNAEVIKEYPLWQRRDMQDGELFENIEDFNGYILYITDMPDQYPHCPFDAALDSSQSDSETQIYELACLKNGFLGASILKYPSQISSDEERRIITEDLRQLQGSENANSIMMIETPPDFEGSIIEQVAPNNVAEAYLGVSDKVVSRIMNAFQMPFPAAGLQPKAGGVFNSQEIEDSHKQYNLTTRNERKSMAKTFNKLLEFWSYGPIEVGEINQLTFTETTEQTDLEADGEITDNA